MAEEKEKLEVNPKDAARITDWLKNRNGLAIWKSLDLSNPGRTWTTPVNDASGNLAGKPHWAAASSPFRIITDMDEVVVVRPVLYKRFRVAVRVGGNGLLIKCTLAASKKISKVCDVAAEEHGSSWYEFDYSTQEAVIFVPGEKIPLRQWPEKSNCANETSSKN